MDPLIEQMKQIVENMQTASDMMKTVSTEMNFNQRNNQEMFADIAAQVAGGGYGGFSGGYGGGGLGGGGRGGGYYSGGGSIGPRGVPVPTGHQGTGGGLSRLQRSAAQAAHNRYGLGAARYVEQRDQNGQITHYNAFNRETGAPVLNGQGAMAEIGTAEVGARGAVSSVAGALGRGGTIGALRAVPGVGTAMMGAEALYQVSNFVSNQRAANAQYQSIYGGSNMEGMGQRVHAEGFKLRNSWDNLFGGGNTLTQGDADKAFKGVSAMGMQGSQRNKQLDFATSNYKSLGMSVDESLQLIGINAKQASTNLGDLHNQLKAVGDMAKQTGQNADVMRQSFIKTYGTNVQSSLGQASGAISTAEVAMSAGLGRPFGGLDYTSMYNTGGSMAVLAAQSGYQNSAQFSAMAQDNPMIMAGAMDNQLAAAFEAVVPPQVKAQIQQLIDQAGGGDAVANNPGAQQNIAHQIQLGGMIQEQVLRSALKARNLPSIDTLSIEALFQYMVLWVAQKGKGLEVATAKQMAKTDQKTTTFSGKAGALDTRTMGVGVTSSYNAATNTTTVTTDPVIANLTKGIGANGMVQVQTADGPQIVTVTEATKNFRDQLIDGTAVIATGADKGSTVGQKYGKEYNAKKGTSSVTKKGFDYSAFGKKDAAYIQGLNLSPEDLGHLAQQFKGNTFRSVGGSNALRYAADKMSSKEASGSGGNITVGITPELAKYLNITTSGKAIVEGGAAAGAPPALSAPGQPVK